MTFLTPEVVITISVIAMFLLCCVLLVVTDRRIERMTKSTLDLLASYERTNKYAMQMIKAENTEMAVRAESLRKSHDIQLRAMEDTMAEINIEEEPKDNEPRRVMTADGREIDLRDWEVVG